jgi:hypothetical protein
MLLGADSPCCRHRCLVQWTALAATACVHSDLPHSTLPRADSSRSLLQLSLSSIELSFLQSTAFAAAAQLDRCWTPPPVAGRRRWSPDAAAGRQTPPPVAAAGRRTPPPVDGRRRRSPPLVALCGRHLPSFLLVDSFRCRLMLLGADSPCCRRRCLVQWTALAATACWYSFW